MNCQNFKVYCLQKHPEYFEQTVTLLNNQWPRSRTARLRSLEQGSKDGLPTSLVLVLDESSGKKTVVAHSKISPVPHQSMLCFVESVVVAPELRGKGLGRLIMLETENYVKKFGVTTVYLTTFDQQDFYRKVGYDFTDPIVVFGGSSKLMEKTGNLSVSNTNSHSRQSTELLDQGNGNNANAEESRCINITPLSPSAPPPPPLPPPTIKIVSNNNNNAIAASKLTMRKFLSS